MFSLLSIAGFQLRSADPAAMKVGLLPLLGRALHLRCALAPRCALACVQCSLLERACKETVHAESLLKLKCAAARLLHVSNVSVICKLTKLGLLSGQAPLEMYASIACRGTASLCLCRTLCRARTHVLVRHQTRALSAPGLRWAPDFKVPGFHRSVDDEAARHAHIVTPRVPESLHAPVLCALRHRARNLPRMQGAQP